MKLFPRLFLLGAVVPTVAAAIVSAGVVGAFAGRLEDELDRALLAQAAVESVSLFDGPEGLHLHMSTSPLLERVRQFAPQAAVYDEVGARMLRFPADAALPPKWEIVLPLPAAGVSSTRLLTTPDGAARWLVVSVPEPHGVRRYTLVLSASRGHLQQTLQTLQGLVAVSVVSLLALLSALTFVWARQLSTRVTRLIDHQARVSRGQLDEAPPADSGGDEIAALRDAVAAATAELQAGRLARERFLAEAAHELRTPLASMRVAIDLALRRVKKVTPSSSSSSSSSPSSSPAAPVDPVVADLVAALDDAGLETARLTGLAQGLLEVTAARSAPMVRESTDVVPTVRAAVAARVDEAAACGIVIDVDAPADGVRAPVHVASVRRAIDNLVDNAVKHARTHVQVAVDVDDAVVRIAVIDDGAGIPADAVAAVFEPFHRVDQGGSGVGLGLAIVREVAGRHGGDVVAAPGPGGRFVLTLPR